MNIIDKNELIEFFSKLPKNYAERSFELDLTNKVKCYNSDLEIKERLDKLEKILNDILNTGESEKIEYAAFYSLAILYRYRKEYDKAE